MDEPGRGATPKARPESITEAVAAGFAAGKEAGSIAFERLRGRLRALGAGKVTDYDLRDEALDEAMEALDDVAREMGL